MTPIEIGQRLQRSTPNPSGTPEIFAFTVEDDRSLTIETAGAADVQVRLYGPFPTIEQSVPPEAEPRMTVQGVAQWGTKYLLAGHYLATVVQNTPGSFDFTIRNWRFGDKVIANL